MNQQSRKGRIIRQTFQIIQDQYLHNQILFLPIHPNDAFLQISLLVNHKIPSLCTPISSQITFTFPSDYPNSPPCMSIKGFKGVQMDIPSIIIESPLLRSGNWKKQTTLKKILTYQIELIDAYWHSYFGFGAKTICFENKSSFSQVQIKNREQGKEKEYL